MPRTKPQRQPGNRRAAIYARVSDKSQAEDDKTSLGEQTSDMEAYCAEARPGDPPPATRRSVAAGPRAAPSSSACSPTPPPARFDTIVCWKSDRLSRGMYPAAALMEVVEAHGIGLEAVMDAIDMKTFGLMAAIGKIELDNFRERASMGKRGTAKQGRIPVSNVPDGYRIGEGRTPEVDEERAAVIPPHLPPLRRRRHGRAGHRLGAHGRRRPHGDTGSALARDADQPHPPQRGLPRHLVVRQGPPHRHRLGHAQARAAPRRLDRRALPAARGRGDVGAGEDAAREAADALAAQHEDLPPAPAPRALQRVRDADGSPGGPQPEHAPPRQDLLVPAQDAAPLLPLLRDGRALPAAAAASTRSSAPSGSRSWSGARSGACCRTRT